MKIKLYVRAGDPYSDMVKNLLKYYKVEAEIIDISKSQENRREMYEISDQYSTPVLVVDDKVFAGFDREKIKEVLGIKNQ